MKQLLTIFALGIWVCATAQDNPIGITYHNVTARYNGYFIAKERMKEIEQQVYNSYEWNYNAVLPIFAQYDTTTSKALEEQITDCVEKASIAIQRHPESRWEDDAYILVGKARMYGSEFPDAIETFKWVNTNGDNEEDQHRALINLLRTFTEAREYQNAQAVSDFLDRQELSNDNLLQLLINRAYLYQVREDYDRMVQNLVAAEEMMSRSNDDRARIEFIIGQVYQKLGFDANAYGYYKKALKRSKTYELSFYTKLNMAQVTQLSRTGNVKKVQKYFRKLLNDPKNEEYKDRIYYEMGEFDLKRGEIASAIDYYKQSASVGKNRRQKAYAFLQLGRIYYDSLRDFELAKNYYDSTLQVLPEDEENYARIKSRQTVLEEFVGYYLTLQENDSLIALSKLPEDSLNQFLVYELRRREETFLQEREQQKKQKRREAIVRSADTYNQDSQVTISADLSGTWYFYNTSEVSKGASEFQRIWGSRALEDNWRRSNKTGLAEQTNDTSSAAITSESNESQEASAENETFDMSTEREKLVAKIPDSDEERARLLAEIETALYELGNIYNFKLEEKLNAISSFNALLDRFPQSEHKPEVLYQLYLLNKELDSMASIAASEALQAEFPESVYAKLLFNPNYVEESKEIEEAYRKAYREAYRLYDEGNYAASLRMIDSALAPSPENEYTDNLALLRAMNLGESDGIYKYQYELNNFIQSYPESELIEYAKVLVKASEDFQINLYSSSRAQYIRHFNAPHYFVVLYPPKAQLSRNVPARVQEVIDQSNFNVSTGNLVFDESYAMVLVNEFKTKSAAQAFGQEFFSAVDLQEEFKGEKLYALLITKDNFDIFYETKDLDTYLTFYERNYP